MTLTLRKPVYSGKFKTMFPKSGVYNYVIEGNKFLVQHNINTDVWIHLDRIDVHL